MQMHSCSAISRSNTASCAERSLSPHRPPRKRQKTMGRRCCLPAVLFASRPTLTRTRKHPHRPHSDFHVEGLGAKIFVPSYSFIRGDFIIWGRRIEDLRGCLWKRGKTSVLRYPLWGADAAPDRGPAGLRALRSRSRRSAGWAWQNVRARPGRRW